MKVLLIIERFDPAYGGAERYAADLAARLAAAGAEVSVAAGSFRDLPPGVRALPVRTVAGPRALRIWDFARRCSLLAPGFDVVHGLGKFWGVDVLHPHGGSHPASLEGLSRSEESPAARWASAVLRRLSPRQGVFRRIEGRMYGAGGARVVIAVSRRTAEDLRARNGVPLEKLRVLYNPVDACRFKPGGAAEREGVRRRFGIPAGAFVCLFSANHFRLKGLDPLLRAAARMGREAPVLVIVGRDRPGRHRRLAARLGLADRAVFAGFTAEPEAFYAAADAFALPTFYDPCSLTVLEAMACGLPVVTSRWNGASELIEHGRDGLVLEDPARDDLLAGLLGELRDPGRRRELGERAREKALAWTPDSHYRALMDVYDEVVRSPAR